MPKQWRIPLPDGVITAMLVFPIGFTLVILYYSSMQALVVSSALLGLGFVVYDFIEKARANSWCEFEAYVPWSEGMREKLEFTLAQ